MATKADFTEDEWKMMQKGVIGAGMLVSVSDRDFTDSFGEASALAARLAAGPTRALGLSKRLLNESFETDLADSLEREAAYQSLATTSDDLVEGMAAFKERRDPRFTGR